MRIRFLGLRNLSVVYEELKHDAELMYEEQVGVPSVELKNCVKQADRYRKIAVRCGWLILQGLFDV